jgi:hypothetical protein
MANTPARTPPMEPTDEATEATLEMAREQGQALERALRHMTGEEAHDGGEVAAGDYVVAYAVEEAEGMHVMQGGHLTWTPPTDENCHLEVAVCDGADGRFVPGLEVSATLVDSDGREVGTHEQPFVWHPWLYHYGRNWRVPGDGVYTLTVRIEPPSFHRHDKTNGDRYRERVEVTFEGVKIQTGQKKS